MNGHLSNNGSVMHGTSRNERGGPPSKPGYINEKLPKEILLMIFGYLDITALCRCSQVCKFWKEMAFDGSNWKVINLFNFQRDVSSNVMSKIAEISARFLRELRVKGCININDNDIKNLAKQCPLIEDLTLSECVSLNNDSIHYLTEFCSNLTSLFIDSCTHITDDGIKKIGACSGIMKLDLSFCDITDEALRPIARGCRQLTFLRLKGCSRVTGAGISEIARACPGLRLLNCNYVAEVSDNALAVLAQCCPELQTLCVSNTAVTDAGLKALSGNLSAFTLSAGPLLAPAASSGRVDSSTVGDGDGGVGIDTAGGDSASTPRNRHHQQKQPQRLSYHQPQQLGCRELTVLEVSRCRITDTGISHVAGACHRLERLDLEDCGSITDASLAFLAMHCGRLHTLLLSHCDLITDSGVHKLVQDGAASSNTGAGGDSVRPGRPTSSSNGGCHQLEYLALDNCPLLTDEALSCLGRDCPNLRKLDLYDCQLITKQAIQKLESANEHLVIQSYFAPNTPEGAGGQRRRKVCNCCLLS